MLSIFKGEAREQINKDLKQMAKAGWHARIVSNEGVQRGQVRAGRLTVLYGKEWLSSLLRRSHKL